MGAGALSTHPRCPPRAPGRTLPPCALLSGQSVRPAVRPAVGGVIAVDISRRLACRGPLLARRYAARRGVTVRQPRGRLAVTADRIAARHAKSLSRDRVAAVRWRVLPTALRGGFPSSSVIIGAFADDFVLVVVQSVDAAKRSRRRDNVARLRRSVLPPAGGVQHRFGRPIVERVAVPQIYVFICKSKPRDDRNRDICQM